MKAAVVILAVLAVLCACAPQTNAAAKVPPGPIKHVIVLMMENRAFDHMLGWLNKVNPSINGLNGTESNPWDVTKPEGTRLTITKAAEDAAPDFDHSINGTSMQIYATHTPGPDSIPNMQGFVASARDHLGDKEALRAMDTWTPDRVPIISTLAQNFALFDEYYASVPGPTDVNRLFLHSATSLGEGHNNVPEIIMGYPQRTLYELLDEAGYDWSAFFGELPDPLFFSYTRQPKFWDRLHLLKTFYKRLETGDLPAFTFLSPNYFGIADLLANDQHPDHAVSAGEALMKRIYEALRASPIWDSSALLITYDEHGGFYDHVTPPTVDVPNPDGKTCPKPPFKFDRLGVRIPTMVISPWVDARVHHAPTHNKPFPSSQYDHTSLIATLTRMWGLNGPLNKRDAWAAPWDFIFKERTAARTDCPLTLPPVHIDSVNAYMSKKAHRPEHKQPLNELQKELVQLGNAVTGRHPDSSLDTLLTEEEGSIYLNKIMLDWIESNRASMNGARSTSKFADL